MILLIAEPAAEMISAVKLRKKVASLLLLLRLKSIIWIIFTTGYYIFLGFHIGKAKIVTMFFKSIFNALCVNNAFPVHRIPTCQFIL